MQSEKMIYLRNPNNRGVVAFLTQVDTDICTILYRMSVCSKKDQWVKKISRKICKDKPLAEGLVRYDKEMAGVLKEFGMLHLYFEWLIYSNVIAKRDELSREKRSMAPRWAYDLIKENVLERFFSIHTLN